MESKQETQSEIELNHRIVDIDNNKDNSKDSNKEFEICLQQSKSELDFFEQNKDPYTEKELKHLLIEKSNNNNFVINKENEIDSFSEDFKFTDTDLDNNKLTDLKAKKQKKSKKKGDKMAEYTSMATNNKTPSCLDGVISLFSSCFQTKFENIELIYIYFYIIFK